MKLYLEALKLLFRKFILKKNNGMVVKKFAQKMGIVYIKLAQILATQNFGKLFTEDDRKALNDICDSCNPIPFEEIEQILIQEYGTDLDKIFKYIDETPVGSASVSQVHRAILKNGDEVAIKVKRKDVAKTMEKDLKTIEFFIHTFGGLFKFKNFTGSDHALSLYLDWIRQETDFEHEIENIKLYQGFANNVNGRIAGTKTIKISKLYEQYCTDQVIVMEFIKATPISKMELNEENKSRIVNALNSYIQLSFWAMFNDQPIIFHGDPHSGNICIDDNGDIIFLDMGLLCALSKEDAQLCRKFFLTAYSGNYEKLYNMLVRYGNMTDEQKQSFMAECKKYCSKVNNKEVTNYFIDMINVCLNYEFVPPDFLFNMAKAFVCLNGINNFSQNEFSAKKLLLEQVTEFMIKRSFKDGKELAIDSLKIMPRMFEPNSHFSLSRTFSKIIEDEKLTQDLRTSLENLQEMLYLMKMAVGADTEEFSPTKR